AFANPHTVNGIILVNGATPTDSIWKNGTQGTSDHSAEFLVSSFSGGGGGGGGGGGAGSAPLPVTLLNFIAYNNGTLNRLQWNTASEFNNTGFDIMRSTDGVNYSKIGWIEGGINSTQLRNYIYDDKNISPNTKYYYHLIQIDINGSGTNSETRVIAPSTDLSVHTSVFPNPFNSELNIILSSNNISENTMVEITDICGRIIYNEKVSLKNGTAYINMPTAHLAAGIYLLTLTTNHEVQTLKLVKE
ncbi:MAG: T9SS type A sorting domain-containing protein, partial [Bacteroidota bacterium]|nr:T9SS type A sorting domain-containing protein [Bacteroidota bacterium]